MYASCRTIILWTGWTGGSTRLDNDATRRESTDETQFFTNFQSPDDVPKNCRELEIKKNKFARFFD